MKQFLICLFLINLFFCQSANSADTGPFRRELFAVHPKLGYNLNFYKGDIRQFSPIIDCGLFTDGSGSGLTPSISVEIPVSRLSHISFGLGYSDRSGSFVKNTIDVVRDLINPPYDTVHVYFGQKIDITLKYIEFQADFRTVLLEKLINGPLRAFAGFRAGYAIDSYAEQTESITSPAEAVYIIDTNYSKKRNIAKGDITDINKISFGITAGIENMLYIGRGNYLTQSASIDYNFNPVVRDIKWNLLGIRFDIGLRYNFREAKQTVPPLLPPDPDWPQPQDREPVKAMVPVLDIKIVNPDFKMLTGNELLATLPLVNAVFFENGSGEIPGKYKLDATGMPEFFSGDAVEAHSWVLPRIAAIIKKNPEASIVIEGATSGRFERGGIQLALKRAEAVRKAFIKLGVAPGKVTVKANYKPRIESNEAFEAGYAENQRADIFVRSAPLQEYVALQKFAEISGKYTLVTKNLYTSPDSGQVTVSTTFPETSSIVGAEPAPKEIRLEKHRINPNNENLTLGAEIKYMEYSSSDSKDISIPALPKEIVDLDVSRFVAVIRFDYNSSALSDDNKGLLKQMAEFLPAGSTILVSGSADALGAEERNKALEKERAENTQNYIQSVSSGKFSFEWASDVGKMPEDTPEGRFLNRNIKIRVKK